MNGVRGAAMPWSFGIGKNILLQFGANMASMRAPGGNFLTCKLFMYYYYTCFTYLQRYSVMRSSYWVGSSQKENYS